jgi:phosphohistidine phosphatase
MILYFLRHAEAEEGYDINDHDRRLTEQGVRRTGTAARVMASLGLCPAHIFCSPRARARQTAEIVAAALKRPIETSEEMNLGFGPQAVETLISGLEAESEVMFVGHEPSMSVVIEESPRRESIWKRAAWRIDLLSHAPQGVLIWLIPPKVFDVLAQNTRG